MFHELRAIAFLFREKFLDLWIRGVIRHVGQQAAALGKLAEFVSRTREAAELLNHPRSLAGWASCLALIAERLNTTHAQMLAIICEGMELSEDSRRRLTIHD